MRCLMCGAEMDLVELVEDTRMEGVPGFRHQTFNCPKCHEIEQRFTFDNQAAPPIALSIPIDTDES